jgi:hypothetical protein
MLRSTYFCGHALAVSSIAFGIGFAVMPVATADDSNSNLPGLPAPIQVNAADTSENAAPAAVTACSAFAQVLDGSSQYYGDFADSFEGSDYSDPAVQSSNDVGRTALRQAAGVAMDASNVPGLQPDIADPMRMWSVGATKLLLKMGLRLPGETLNPTANEMNNYAELVQHGCAAAGTHA